MAWTVHLTRKARKQLAGLPEPIRGLAGEAMAALEEQGVNPQDWNTLKTGDGEYRLRLNYRYRMRYRVAGRRILDIEVFYVGHRQEAYR